LLDGAAGIKGPMSVRSIFFDVVAARKKGKKINILFQKKKNNYLLSSKLFLICHWLN